MIVALAAGYSIAQMGGGMMGGYQQPANPNQYQQQYPYQGGPGMMGGGMGMMGPGMMGGYQQPVNPNQYQQQYPYQGGPGMMGGGMGMMGPGMMGGGMMGGYQQPANPYQYQQQYPDQRGSGTGYGRGSGYGYDAEKYQKFLDDTTKLRKELHEKQFEYSEAMRNPDTKRETIDKVENEIQELQKKIYEKAPR
jgi:SWI/SNF chromatin-remodeling complex subunit SWI1